MEISKEHLVELEQFIGRNELIRIFGTNLIDKLYNENDEDEKIEFDENLIYVYVSDDEIYKLHRIEKIHSFEDSYAFVNLRDSDSYANGMSTAINQIEYASSYNGLFIFKTIFLFSVWLTNEIKKY